ncbi:hypothetical protein ZOSMA_542G00030 [Zostera marina]|uniref:C17orf113 probable zinc finger domain-containing protein n=1 Tax=Zostera marina TaxID=29655 RepID=A0A0K9NX25_ZOSMR|nr:hypothetical protein ZOSMA_542G00030 [Zostera marina]
MSFYLYFFFSSGDKLNTKDDITLLRQAQKHHLVIGEEIDLEIGPNDDDHTFTNKTMVGILPQDPTSPEEQEDHKQVLLVSQAPNDEQIISSKISQAKRKVVKKWREEWAETYKWAYVNVNEGTTRIFCSVCKEYRRKNRRNPYGNEGSRNMQMSALEEHNNSLLHKEALRLQSASISFKGE